MNSFLHFLAAIKFAIKNYGFRKSIASSIAVTFLSMGLGGCAGFDGYPKRATDPAADLAKLQTHINADAIQLCLATPNLTCRSQLIGSRMYAIDIRFSEFEETLFRDTRTVGFGATVATLGLSTAAAASSGGATQWLSGLSALIIGSREAYQKEVLAERTIIAIHTAMRSRRAEIALRLRAGLVQTMSQYPIGTALGDLEEYYSAGTVLGALVGITETVGSNAKKAENELKSFSFKLDAVGNKVKLAVCGNDENCLKPDMEMWRRAWNCWAELGIPANTPMVDFLMEKEFSSQRSIVAICMRL